MNNLLTLDSIKYFLIKKKDFSKKYLAFILQNEMNINISSRCSYSYMYLYNFPEALIKVLQ